MTSPIVPTSLESGGAQRAPSAEEAAAYAHMQARLVSLLLRYDERLFPRYYGVRGGGADQAGWLRPYRDLAAFYLLRDELFDHILPRIVRRLSFESPRSTEREEPPARGRVDWSRTLAATWDERPGEPPLELITRRRRRDFATPENLLAVATLLEYRADALRLLEDERVAQGDEALTHPLVTIAQRCERELAFPQFASLRHAAERAAAGGLEALEAEVAERAIPGGNSAYQELIAWRARRRELRLLDRSAAGQPETLGADPARDNYLYQIWLFYEIADLLKRQGRLVAWAPGEMALTYTWGAPGDERRYLLRHDRAIPQHWANAPGVRPDLYIAHVDRHEVSGGGELIWHEPGFVLDAKYYKPRDTSRAPASPVKRMIADLRLAGERHGALLFAFQKGGDDSPPGDAPLAPDELEPDLAGAPAAAAPLYRVAPRGPAAQQGAPDETLAIWRVQPQIGGGALTERALAAILEEAHQALRERRVPRCHGVFLDTVSAAAAPALTDRWGGAIAGPAGDLLLCPKPHIGPWRVDLVSQALHCCRDARLCHIVGQPGVQPPVRPPRTQEDLVSSVSSLRTWLREHLDADADDEAAEQARAQLIRSIGELTETYIQLTQADTAQTEQTLREWVFGQYWSEAQHPRGLPQLVRQMLISGEYVWAQFQKSSVEDWAACAVQYTRALEYEIHRRMYDPCGTLLVNKDSLPIQSHQFTIGTPMSIYSQRKKTTSWQTLLDLVAHPSGADEATLRQLVIDIEALRPERNKVAHTQHVDAALALKIREAVLGRQGQPGLLYRLISALQAPPGGPAHA